MILLFTYLFIALFFSFICSLMEAAFLSTPLTYLKVKALEGQKSAEKLIKYKLNVNKSLSSILTLNTIANTFGAAGVGAQATLVFGEAYFGLFSGLLTLMILILSEIIPKTIGAIYWSKLTKATYTIISIMIVTSYPFVLLSEFITQIITKNQVHQAVSKDEISMLTQLGTDEGIFEESENLIIQNMLKLKSIRVDDVMTPRVVVNIVSASMRLVDFNANKDNYQFSRLPIYEGSRDNITGYVFRQTIFERLAEGADSLKINDLKREIAIVIASQPLLKAWKILLEQKEHIALVVDEYGAMDGIITMEDIIEALLGLEIVDEKDSITDMQEFARKKWQIRKKYGNVFESNE